MLYLLELISVALGGVGLFLAYQLFLQIRALPDGNDRMRLVAGEIRTGAMAFLKEQATHLVPFVLVVFLLVAIALDTETAVAYILGSGLSLLAGYLGMHAATIANVRTAFCASEKRATDALMVAFNGGSVMGLTVAGLGVAGLSVLCLIWGDPEHHERIIGFGMGASSVALFARIGGGIYTKAADVGSDLVGKVEAGIPEDDPRNPGVIADNVGDNVGDIAGMGADIFESFVSITIGCLALAATMTSMPALSELSKFELVPDGVASLKSWLMLTPVFNGALGLIATYLGILLMRKFHEGDPAVALRRVTVGATVIYVGLAFVYFLLTPVAFRLWFCVVFGALAGLGIGFVSEYYTASKPIRDIVAACKSGPATCVISGISVGLTSCAVPLILIVLATGIAHYFGGPAGGIYGSALAGVAMLATVGMTMTIDAYGPIADNAGGISEMSHLGPESRAITDRLDAIGNTTAAIGKGFAIGASGLTALSLFAAYAQTVQKVHPDLNLSILNTNLVIGVFLGAILPCMIAALTMKSVGKAAGLMVLEIRRQFKEIKGLLEGVEGVKPDVSRCVAISTRAALTEMRLPGAIAIISPILVGLILGPEALGGLLLGTTVVGVVLGIFMANAGGAWDNAKKYIEQGKIEGEKKGTPAHAAAVVGDTVGDPFKDTSGPALNILIKLVSILSLLIAPLL